MDQFPSNSPEVRMTLAEARFCIEQESSCRLTDFFNRRTGRLYFDLPSIDRVKNEVSTLFQEALGWDAQRMKEENELLNQEIQLSEQIVPVGGS